MGSVNTSESRVEHTGVDRAERDVPSRTPSPADRIRGRLALAIAAVAAATPTIQFAARPMWTQTQVVSMNVRTERDAMYRVVVGVYGLRSDCEVGLQPERGDVKCIGHSIVYVPKGATKAVFLIRSPVDAESRFSVRSRSGDEWETQESISVSGSDR